MAAIKNNPDQRPDDDVAELAAAWHVMAWDPTVAMMFFAHNGIVFFCKVCWTPRCRSR